MSSQVFLNVNLVMCARRSAGKKERDRMRKGVVLLAVVALVCAGASLVASTATAGSGYKKCGTVSGQRGSATVKEKNYNCDGARKFIRVKLSITGTPPGWTCVSPHGDFEKLYCKNGRHRVRSRVI